MDYRYYKLLVEEAGYVPKRLWKPIVTLAIVAESVVQPIVPYGFGLPAVLDVRFH